MSVRTLEKNIYNMNLVKNSLCTFNNFVNASTIDNANQFAKDKITTIIRIDYSNFDLRIANEYNKHMLVLLKLYPQVKFSYLGIGQDEFFIDFELKKLNENELFTDHLFTSRPNGVFYSRVKGLYEDSVKLIKQKYDNDYIGKVMDQNHGKYEGIWINPVYARSHKKLLQEIKTLVSCKQAPKIEPSTEYILTHEFGHLLLDFLTNDWCEETFVDELWNYLNKKYDYRLKDYLKDNLSIYAFKNKSEFFCEAFAEFIHSSKPRPLAKLVGEELEHGIKFRNKVEQI